MKKIWAIFLMYVIPFSRADVSFWDRDKPCEVRNYEDSEPEIYHWDLKPLNPYEDTEIITDPYEDLRPESEETIENDRST